MGTEKSSQGLLPLWRDQYSQQEEMDQVFYGVTSICDSQVQQHFPAAITFVPQPNLWEQTIGVCHDGHHVSVKTFPTPHTCNCAVRTTASDPASSFLVPADAPYHAAEGKALPKQPFAKTSFKGTGFKSPSKKYKRPLTYKAVLDLASHQRNEWKQSFHFWNWQDAGLSGVYRHSYCLESHVQGRPSLFPE